MNKNILCVIFIILLSNTVASQAGDFDYSGFWCWDKNNKNNSFVIEIKKNTTQYSGSYFSVALGGRKMDERIQSFSFESITQKPYKTTFISGNKGAYGVITLKFLNPHIIWDVILYPQDEIYVPKHAVLKKCNKEEDERVL